MLAEEPRLIRAEVASQMAQPEHAGPPAHVAELRIPASPLLVGLARSGDGEAYQARADRPDPIDRAEQPGAGAQRVGDGDGENRRRQPVCLDRWRVDDARLP